MQTTTNIHGVKSIRLERVVFDTFVSHKFTFELEDGSIHIDGFASDALEIEIVSTRSTFCLANTEAEP